MSLSKDSRSPYWRFDFQIGGHRFFGSTKCTNKREAEAVEKQEREKAKRSLAQQRTAVTSLKLDDVAGRYWIEIGQHHAGARGTERQLSYLIDFLGKDILVTDIGDADVARMIAWRRGHRTRTGALVSPYSVNDLTEQLRKLMNYAKLTGARFDREPQWRRHRLAEPQERVRELVGDEGERIEAAARGDYQPFFAFLRASGLRLNEAVTLRWHEVDWGARQIRKPGKGGKLCTVPITSALREILWPLQGHHPEAVFTYVADRTRDGRQEGERYPLTLSGVSTQWRRLRKRSGVTGFRIHDFRHDFGSKLLRSSGNMKIVQRAMNHSDVRTTARYAHVLDEDVADAIELAQSPNPSPIFLRKLVS